MKNLKVFALAALLFVTVIALLVIFGGPQHAPSWVFGMASGLIMAEGAGLLAVLVYCVAKGMIK